jgi:hypothetical protein
MPRKQKFVGFFLANARQGEIFWAFLTMPQRRENDLRFGFIIEKNNKSKKT